MIAIRHVQFTAAALILAACASMPLSTLMRGASFNESTVGFVDARALGVKVSLPEGFVLDVSNTKLTALVDSASGQRKVTMTLEPVATTKGKRTSVVSKDVEVTTFEMDLPEESVKSLRELQHLVAGGKAKKVSLDVSVSVSEVPPGATNVKLWVELMMSPMEGYFTLIDGGTLPLNKAAVPAGS
jgi:hypothetical protein